MPGPLSERVGEAVAEIEPGRMPSLAVTSPAADRALGQVRSRRARCRLARRAGIGPPRPAQPATAGLPLTMPSSTRIAAGMSRAGALSRWAASSSLPGSLSMTATAADVSTTRLVPARSPRQAIAVVADDLLWRPVIGHSQGRHVGCQPPAALACWPSAWRAHDRAVPGARSRQPRSGSRLSRCTAAGQAGLFRRS